MEAARRNLPQARVRALSKAWSGGRPDASGNPESGKYEVISQKLFNYISGAEVPSDPELRDEITELCKEIPTVPASTFEELRDLDSGSKWNERSASTNTGTAAESSKGSQFPPVALEEKSVEEMSI
jgi:hypothetical protein